MKIKLVTFSDGSFGFRSAGRRLARQADRSGWFDSPSEHWTLKKLESRIPDFATIELPFIKQNKKGLGLWIWKAAVLDYELRTSQEGDIIVMLDSGCQLNINDNSKLRFKEYVQFSEINSILLMQIKDGAFEFADLSDSVWTKTQTLDYLDPEGKYRFSNQIQSGIIIIKNDVQMRSLIKDWMMLCQLEDHQLLVDPKDGEPQDSGFIQHRWEQSILSLLVKSKGLSTISDETYFYPKWHEGENFPIWAMRNRSGGDAKRRNLIDLGKIALSKLERMVS